MDTPSLAQMTDKAIELLSKNDNGFFLQVEGASIDKQDHAANVIGLTDQTDLFYTLHDAMGIK
ncbi:hypothetical protein GCM10022405_10680 [Gibbsiella dentisursi]|uniref:Alkaline phosphatase n=1 Tax=Gibbsiella dentisursi TaxID=796890 RepID=A0ABP7KTL8_9GAMM